MAKYQVLQAFTDKNTGKVYQPGDRYPANSKKARITELLGDDHNVLVGPIIAEEVSDGVSTTSDPIE